MPSVTITQAGREGQVTYHDGARSITGYQEFGGGDVVAIVSMGTVSAWERQHAWALPSRAVILRTVADEVIRQCAPGCVADIDESRGDILLRAAAAADDARPTRAPTPDATSRAAAPGPAASRVTPRATDAAWVRRAFDLRRRTGLAVLVATVVIAGTYLFGRRALSITPGPGTPLNRTARSDTHVATIISTLEPYVPSLHRSGADDRFTLSLFLVPLDGSATALVPLARGQEANDNSLARVIGSDGRHMWVEVAGLHGVDLRTHTVIGPAELQQANPQLDALLIEDTRGMDIVDGRLRLLAADRSRAIAIDPETLRGTPVPPTPSGRPPIEPRPPTIRTEPVELHRVAAPDGVLTGSTASLGPDGTLLVSRVDATGATRWTTDTGIDRFRLEQVLPGPTSTVFVGPRVPIPGKLSEPLLVIVEHATGRARTVSLWQ